MQALSYVLQEKNKVLIISAADTEARKNQDNTGQSKFELKQSTTSLYLWVEGTLVHIQKTEGMPYQVPHLPAHTGLDSVKLLSTMG